MIVDTEHLFLALIKKLKVSFVFDIGSRDGIQSLQIRESLPDAKIIAFEASPDNYEYMINVNKLKDNNISIQNMAISNFNGISDFHIYKDNKYKDVKLSGLNSLFKRPDLEFDRSVKIKTCRIDDYVINNDLIKNNIALWIDVEGADFQVLEGIERIKDRVSIIHVEVLSDKIYDGNQKTKKQIDDLMQDYNFVEAASSFEEEKSKFSFGNLIYLNKIYIENTRINIKYYLWKTYFLFKIRKFIIKMTKNNLHLIYNYAKKVYLKFFLK